MVQQCPVVLEIFITTPFDPDSVCSFSCGLLLWQHFFVVDSLLSHVLCSDRWNDDQLLADCDL